MAGKGSGDRRGRYGRYTAKQRRAVVRDVGKLGVKGAGETQSNDPEPPLGVIDPAETCGDRCDPGCGAPCADDTTEDCDETGAGCGDTPEDCDETGAGCGDTPENGGGDVPDPQPCVEDAGPEGGEAIDWGAARAQATPKTGCEAVASADAFNACAADAKPGELIVIADGSYDGWRLAVPSDGAIYTAETPGGVTFTGTHELGLLVTGDDNIIGGFRFEACGDNFVVFNGGSGNRFTDNRFDGCGQNSGWRILGIRDAANGNRFDHNHFINATAKNATVDQPRDGETHFATSVGNRFDHNLFEGTGKKQPALQIAQYAAPEHYNPNPTNTIVDHNVFRSNTGQSVNSKSSGEQYLCNAFFDTGELSLRSGDDKIVEANYFENTKPVHIYGVRHRIINNIIVHARGPAILIAKWGPYSVKRAGSCVLTSGSGPTGDMLIAHNTVLSDEGAVELGRAWGYQNEPGCVVATNPPEAVRFYNNIFIGTADTLFDHIDSANTAIDTNLYFATGTARTGDLGQNAIEADPMLDAEHRPDAASPAVGSASDQGVERDYYLQLRNSAPNIGAVGQGG